MHGKIGFSVAARMPLVPCRSEICAHRKSRRWKMYTDVHFSSGTVHTVCVSSRGARPAASQDRCCSVGIVVVPIRTSGVIRIILPAATAFDTVRTGSSTFFCPYRLIHYTINDLIIHFAICLPVVFLFCFLLYGRVPLQQSKSMQRLHRLNKYNVQWSTS